MMMFRRMLLLMMDDDDAFAFIRYSPDMTEPPGASCSSELGKQLPFCRELAAAQGRAALVMSEPFLVCPY